jgi:hypothetical protein
MNTNLPHVNLSSVNPASPNVATANSQTPSMAHQMLPPQLSFGSRAQLISELKFGSNRVVILRYAGANGLTSNYTSEITKDEDTQLLVLPSTICYLRSQSKISLDHYGLRESGVSGFIKSQVTGESFVMTEVKGKGLIRQTPSAESLGLKVFNNLKLCLPNTNITYLRALMGKFEVLSPQKSKSDTPIIFSEIRCESALVLIDNDNFYPIPVSPGNPVFVEGSEIVFWTGDLNLNEDRNVSNSEGNFIEFSGSGEVYISLNN